MQAKPSKIEVTEAKHKSVIRGNRRDRTLNNADIF